MRIYIWKYLVVTIAVHMWHTCCGHRVGWAIKQPHKGSNAMQLQDCCFVVLIARAELCYCPGCPLHRRRLFCDVACLWCVQVQQPTQQNSVRSILLVPDLRAIVTLPRCFGNYLNMTVNGQRLALHRRQLICDVAWLWYFWTQ